MSKYLRIIATANWKNTIPLILSFLKIRIFYYLYLVSEDSLVLGKVLGNYWMGHHILGNLLWFILVLWIVSYCRAYHLGTLEVDSEEADGEAKQTKRVLFQIRSKVRGKVQFIDSSVAYFIILVFMNTLKPN